MLDNAESKTATNAVLIADLLKLRFGTFS